MLGILSMTLGNKLTLPSADAYTAPAQGADLSIIDILQADNLIDLLPEDSVAKMGQRALDEFNMDLDSRRGDNDPQSWEQRYDRYLDIAMQVRKTKTFPWPGAANLKFPLLTSAAIQFQARAYPVIVDGSNLVKGRINGPDPDGTKRQRADLLGDHMTWQLLYDMPGWEEDTDRLLLMLPIVGCVFRKTYYDSITRKNVSKMITGKDFVINYWAKSIEEAPRYTQIMRFYPYEVEERIRSGQWAEHTLPTTTDPKDESDTAPIEYLEQHRREDLDGDGYPEPYVVTLVRESGKVVRIVPCFDADGVTISNGPNGFGVVRIEPKYYFVKYGFIPSPDGSFYDMGFGQLLDDITAAIDTIGNQLLDAGALQNAQGGFVGSGVNMRSGDLRFRLGEWKRVDVTGGTLAQNIFPLNLPGPSATLLEMFDRLIQMAKEITSLQDVLTGGGIAATTPATTVLAQIQQATKIITAIFKRVHRSFGQELRNLKQLNADNLPDQADYAEGKQVSRADYLDPSADVIPVSDPSQVNDAMKAVRTQALAEWKNDPLINQVVLRQRMLEGSGQPDIAELMNVPPPPPDPKVLIEGAKLALEKMKFDAAYDQQKALAAQQFMTAAMDAQSIGLLNDAAMFAGAAMKLAMESSQYTLENEGGEPTGQPGGDGGVAPAPADAGISGGAAPALVQPDGTMGGGAPDGGGGAGPSGDADAALEPQG
jgi:chaperonin GroES